jgi:predicted nucleic acid-binding protein
LIKQLDTNSIVCPVELEFLAGITDPREMDLAEEFFKRFRIIDERRILPEDWLEARRIAKHVLKDSGRRDLSDCLIAAIVNRLRREVLTKDRGLRRQQGRTRQRRS